MEAAAGSRRTGVDDVYRYTAQTRRAAAFDRRGYSSVAERLTAAFAADQALGQCE